MGIICRDLQEMQQNIDEEGGFQKKVRSEKVNKNGAAICMISNKGLNGNSTLPSLDGDVL